ncbi:MAG: glycosyltransferase family 4 protein [Candidatus Methanoperedens sp.]|nr:glycosyltransferase family 4 protein [Candidatus Methanoperedens sp.]
MRIGLTTHTFPPEFIGGREMHVEALARALSKDDDIIIFAGSNVKRVIKEDMGGYTLYKIPAFPITLSKNPLQVYRVVPRFYSVLSKEKLDIIHAHEYGHFTTDIASLYSKVSKTPLVLTVHGYVIENKILGITKKLYDRTIGLKTLKAANKIIAVSKRQKEDIIRWAGKEIEGENILYVPNGIYINEFNDLKFNGESYQGYNFGNSPLVLGVGRLLPRKGFLYLIEAAKKVVKLDPDVKFVIVGPDGGEMQNLIQKINENDLADNFFLLGTVPRNVLRYLYSCANIFVIPSFYEGLPTTLLEAMACGIPVIGSNIDGIQIVVENDRDGLLIPPGNADILADKICLLLRDKILADKLSRNAKKKVEDYDWKKIHLQIKKIYEQA